MAATGSRFWNLQVGRDDLSRTRLVEVPPPVPGPGEAVLRVDRVGVTANNVTYAVLGETFRYWEFFPTEPGWGLVPLWGFAEVAESRAEGVAAGQRVYGYLPSAGHLVVRPGRADTRGFKETSPHRSTLPSPYNTYALTTGGEGSGGLAAGVERGPGRPGRPSRRSRPDVLTLATALIAAMAAGVVASRADVHHAGMGEAVPVRTTMTATLADGRRISWGEYGSPDGAPLVILHGTPGSRLQFQWMHVPAAAAGIRVIAPERPGYGASDRMPGGISFGAYADDLRQLLDHLGLPTVTLCAASGGGGFGLVAAVVHPERFERLILVSAGLPAPRSARRGIALPVRMLLVLARYAPGFMRKLLAAQLSADPDSALSRAGRRFMPTSDRRLLDAPEWRRQFDEDFREALKQGAGAAVHDLALGSGPLGVDPADLTVPTVLLHGTEDVNVPIGIARWVAGHAHSARLIEQRGSGHLFSLENPRLIFEWVARS